MPTEDRFQEEWFFDGDRIAESFNPRRPIRSDAGRVGYLKLLAENHSPDPWLEQWANEQIIAGLAKKLDIPAVEVWAGWVEGEPGAITTFEAGWKVSALETLGFRPEVILPAAVNRDQFGLIVALDLWTLNSDRGAHNAFVTWAENRPVLSLIDHGHTLLLPRNDKLGEEVVAFGEEEDVARRLQGLATVEWTRRLVEGNYVYTFTTIEEVQAGARTIADIGDDDVGSIADGVPDDFFCAPREMLVKLLRDRRDALGAMVEEMRGS